MKVVERKLGWDVVVQVLDIEDTGRSKWGQIEAMEAERKGEGMRGRQVVRVVAAEGGEGVGTTSMQGVGSEAGAGSKSNGPFKVVLQDFKGVKVYGFELKTVEKIGFPGSGSGAMSIGAKILLKKGTKVARGMVLLEPGFTTVLGGKIEGMDKLWREGREKSLRDAVGDRTRRQEHDRENVG